MAHQLKGSDGYVKGSDGYRRGASVNNLTFNGTSQYAYGEHGVNGFDITDFNNWSALTFVLVGQTGAVYNASSTAKRLFELTNSDRTDTNFANFGATSTNMTNEYIGIGRFITTGGVTSPNIHYINDVGGSVVANDAMRVLHAGFNGPTSAQFSNNGSYKTGWSSINSPAHITNATKLALFATTTGVALLAGTFKECYFLKRVLTTDEIATINSYYSANPNASIKDHALYGDASFVELWTMERSGTTLLASKNTNHNLTLIGF